MAISKLEVKSKCNCSAPLTILQLDFAVQKEHLQYFADNGFTIKQSYDKRGILYIENASFMIISPYGSANIEVKCKKKDCSQEIDDFIGILSIM